MKTTKKLFSLIVAAALAIPTALTTAFAAEDSQTRHRYTIQDATVIQKLCIGLLDMTDEYLNIYDVYHDGRISIIDATLVQRHCAGFVNLYEEFYGKEEFRSATEPTTTQPETIVAETTEAPTTTQPETTVAETTEAPTTTQPETTVSETTEAPATTHPETTVAEVTEAPATTHPETTVAETTEAPTTTQPETTVAETTEEPSTAPPKATYIKLSESQIELGLNETVKLSYQTDAAASVTFSVDNSAVLKVDNAGNIKPQKVGSATVYCTTDNGLKASCAVTVKKAATFIKLNKSSLSLGIGEKYGLITTIDTNAAAYYKTFASGNKNVVEIDNNGVITAKGVGTTKITCFLKDGSYASCTVTVKKLATTVSLNYGDVKIGIGETLDFNSSVPANTEAYFRAYYSEDSSVASIVKNTGVLTGVKKGTTRIYCELPYSGVRTYVTVTVMAAPKSISFKESAQTLKVGNTVTLHEYTDSGSYSNAANLKWTVSNSVLKITAKSGNALSVKAMREGICIVTVQTYNGKKNTLRVTVSGSSTYLIDVSYWQGGDVNFDQVKAGGVEYVIIRAGFGTTADKQFVNNYNKAKAAGMKVGAYWYMLASTESGARNEAAACLGVLNGRQLDLPVYYDVEEPSVLLYTSQSRLTSSTEAFCDTVKTAGYKPGVYSSASCFAYNYSLNYDRFVSKDYSIWNAQWGSKCTITCDVWQFTDNGRTSGVPTNVDMSLVYNLYVGE